MKATNLFFLSLMAVAITTGCSADDEMLNGQNKADEPVNTNSIAIEVIDCGMGNGETTRTVYSGLTTTFETGDRIGVYAVDGSGTVQTANAMFTKQAGGDWTTSSTIVFNPGWSYYAYYPYVASPYTPNFAASGIENQFSTFIADASNKFHQADQSTKANYSASDLMIAKGTQSGTNKVVFSMYHKKGLARLSGEGMTFTTFSGNVPYTPGDGYRYYLCKPSTPTTVGGMSLTVASGKYQDCVYDMATIAASATDISMYNTAGTLQGSRSTANCYMIHSAGVYKLPLVYGNAITAGVTKTSAYQAPSGSGTYRMANFKNHANQNIIDPWIKNNSNGSRNINVDGAELLWQDKSSLITAVGAYGDWLVFKVPNAASASNTGNAVIAAKDNGTIVWSWHIWVTTETYASTTTVTTSANTYRVAPVNLGWVATGGGGKQGYCPYYQWGRKDPFLPSTGSSNADHAAYDINGYIFAVEDIFMPVDLQWDFDYDLPGYSECIMVPTVFYYDSFEYEEYDGYYRWYEEEIANLWDSDCNALRWDRSQTSKTVKTVYDPCPAGFCVPTQNLYWYYFGEPDNNWPGISSSLCNNIIWDNTNKGITVLGSIWYPASGVRLGGVEGKLENVGSKGGYWSAFPHERTHSKMLYFSSVYFENSSYVRTCGLPVRPVAE